MEHLFYNSIVAEKESGVKGKEKQKSAGEIGESAKAGRDKADGRMAAKLNKIFQNRQGLTKCPGGGILLSGVSIFRLSGPGNAGNDAPEKN